MRKSLVVLFACFLVSFGCYGDKIIIEEIRLWSDPEKTRFVFDLSGPPDYKAFAVSSPDRYVVDIKNSDFEKNLKLPALKKSPVSKIRKARKDDNANVRIVFDLNAKVSPKSFVLTPFKQYGNRLVVDLYNSQRMEATKIKVVAKESSSNLRDAIIAIDAGHGGEDPGAIGPRNELEKNVVLSIAKKLAKFVDDEPGFRSKLIRKGDYYVGLRKRIEIAREGKADILLSLHADAFKTANVRGASVFAISDRGSTSEEARWLAENQNQTDLIGGMGEYVKIDTKSEPLVRNVLLDLAFGYSQRESLEMGAQVLKELKTVTKLHKEKVEQAGFMVLKAPEVPSILVEVGFISNPKEAYNLSNARHQRKIAKSIFRGVKNYIYDRPPDGSFVAWLKEGSRDVRVHVIEQGDTLSELSLRYRVSLEAIKKFNSVRGDTIKIGQKLRIPAS